MEDRARHMAHGKNPKDQIEQIDRIDWMTRQTRWTKPPDGLFGLFDEFLDGPHIGSQVREHYAIMVRPGDHHQLLFL
jgi:hypothetical protein